MYKGKLDSVGGGSAQWCMKPTSVPELSHMLLHSVAHRASAVETAAPLDFPKVTGPNGSNDT